VKQEWLMPGAVVPVDMETTAALVAEIKRALNQRREWHGLTDDDIAQAMFRADAIFTGPMQFKFAREVEAKLKEKNT